MRKTINGLILALAVCAAPSYGLAKNKNKIEELKQKIDIVSKAQTQLKNLKNLRERVAQAEVSYNAALSNYNNMKTQIDTFERKKAAGHIKAQQLQKEKGPLKEAIAEAELELDTLNGQLAARGKPQVKPESSTILAQG